MTDNRVRIVFTADFGDALRQLDLSVQIWIVRSAQNDPVIADLWKAKMGNITSFQAQEFGQLADTINEHHPGWSELDVHGLRAEEAEMALAVYGGQFISAPDGFVFRRKS
jgi:hypothetical protein